MPGASGSRDCSDGVIGEQLVERDAQADRFEGFGDARLGRASRRVTTLCHAVIILLT